MLFEVAFLDVGPGDCSVVTFDEPETGAPEGVRRRCIVVDGGAEGTGRPREGAPVAAERLAAYLKLRGVRRIDLLIATHIDADHLGGLVTFLEQYTAKRNGQGEAHWNDRAACIGQYWGPSGGVPAEHLRRASGGAEPPHREAVELLAKFKAKKMLRLDAEDRDEIDRLEAEMRDLRARVEALCRSQRAWEVLSGGVAQSRSLHELVRAHVSDPERDILTPDLMHPPPPPFESVQVDLLWPALQASGDVGAEALPRPVNLAAGRTMGWAQHAGETPNPAMDLAQLLQRVWDNRERMAEQAARKAKDQSIVVRIGPRMWSGAPHNKPVVLFSGDAGRASWQQMVRIHGRGRLSSFILKVPDHGAAGEGGMTPEALRAVSPRFAVISVGQTRRLPAAETLNLLRNGTSGALDIFCTERNHNPEQKASCCETPPGCVRRDPKDYRGVVFSFDTEKGTQSVVQLQFEQREGRCLLHPSLVRNHEEDPHRILWCRQKSWGPS